MLSGTHENDRKMRKINNRTIGAKDNLKLDQRNFGEENLVSAVLHMDEKTPHITLL